MNTIRPYKGGNDALCALHDLDIIDKHRLLIPTINYTAVRGVSAEDFQGTKVINCHFMVGPGGVLNGIKAGPGFKITNHGQPTYLVLFDKGTIFEGKPIIQTLHGLSQLILNTIKEVEKGY